MSPVDNSTISSLLEEDLQISFDGKYTHTPVLFSRIYSQCWSQERKLPRQTALSEVILAKLGLWQLFASPLQTALDHAPQL